METFHNVSECKTEVCFIWSLTLQFTKPGNLWPLILWRCFTLDRLVITLSNRDRTRPYENFIITIIASFVFKDCWSRSKNLLQLKICEQIWRDRIVKGYCWRSYELLILFACKILVQMLMKSTPGVNPTKLWFLHFSDFCCWDGVFVAQEKIVCNLKWPTAKNLKSLCFTKKKVW